MTMRQKPSDEIKKEQKQAALPIPDFGDDGALLTASLTKLTVQPDIALTQNGTYRVVPDSTAAEQTEQPIADRAEAYADTGSLHLPESMDDSGTQADTPLSGTSVFSDRQEGVRNETRTLDRIADALARRITHDIGCGWEGVHV